MLFLFTVRIALSFTIFPENIVPKIKSTGKWIVHY